MTQRLHDWLQAGSPLHSHFHVDENGYYGASAGAGTGGRVFRSCLAAPPSPARSTAPPSLTHRPGFTALRYLFLCCGLWLLTAIGVQAQTLELAYTIDSLRCNGDQNAAIAFTVTGGVPPYLYAWRTQSNGFVFASGTLPSASTNTGLVSNLRADTYLVRITDAQGQVRNATVVISAPPPIFVTDLLVQDATCTNPCDGQIRLTLTGGTGSLLVEWPGDGTTGSERTQLCAGDYVFTATDERGCRVKGLLDVYGPAPIVVTADVAPPACTGGDDGAITVSATGGMGEYRYLWADASTVAHLPDLSAGTYPLTVTDAANCTTTATIAVPDGNALAPNVQINYGCGDGRILVSAQPTQGQPPYTYAWSTGSQAPVLPGMSAGAYSLLLRDSRGCQATANFTIQYVSPLAVDVSVTDVTCPAAADGRIALNITGGLTPYQVTWATGDTGTSVDNLGGGEYPFQLVAGGCGIAQSVWLAEPQPLRAIVVFAPTPDDHLSALAIAMGGTPPYQYQWSNGSTGSATTGLLPAAPYELTITDARGCTQVQPLVALLTDTDTPLPDATELRVFPNPSPDGLFGVTALPPHLMGTPFHVLDMTGRLCATGVLSAAPGLVDLRALPAGVYVLQTAAAVVRLVKL